MNFAEQLSKEFGIRVDHSTNIIKLIEEGNTIPFIARYRKELTGCCDDQILREFNDRLNYLKNLAKRKEEVVGSISEQGKMTDEIKKAIDCAITLAEVEDIYRPYKQKRKTRASVAIEKGLQPLADIIFEQTTNENILTLAKEFVDEEKDVKTEQDAICGAKDIIAEKISDDAEIRKSLRQFIIDTGIISTTLDETKENSSVYEMYKDFQEEIKKIPSHRILAINRGKNEDCLKVKINVNEEECLNIIRKSVIKKNSTTKEILEECILDSFDRLIFPSLEREARGDLTDRADEQAIKMFEVNLRPLLLVPPLKGKVILGFDPAYRTGCKIAVIDECGQCLATTVVYPTPPQNKIEESKAKLKELIEKYNVDVIAIGNGTASKESEIFVASLIKELDKPVSYAMVNEAGASVYSASKLGAQEFPDFDVSLRSAVSIARRLQDPLAELIKIDVKSIGVGQYQHDMPQNRLTEVLNGVVEDCVNSVGVDLNTASPSLLSFVSGLNSGIAKSICEYRTKIKKFENRKQLLEVPKLGQKAYEQCAGFLRIVDGKTIFDNTSVHPESYDATKKLLELFNFTEEDVRNGKISELPSLIKAKGEKNVAQSLNIGEITLTDIVNELLKPGRDIRDDLPKPVLRSDLLSLEDLQVGMILDGVVRNVIDFGAFVDIGVHQDGLVHISQISKNYVKVPSDVLKVGDQVKVKVIGVDVPKKRIQLSIKDVEK
ncbi:MAG: Tex family protein [Christensenellales bacterium]